MLTYLGIADRFRPQWIVWENVPGVLSSNKGRDFGTFVGALGELGYGWAYRILDAQWFGVAQRRRRVFVVANFGNTISAAKVLFERESVCRNPAPSREKGKGIATNVAPSLTASNDPSRSPQSSEITQQVNAILEAQVAACLRSGGNGGVPSSRGEHLVVGALCSDSHPGSYSGQDAYTGRLIATAFHPTQDPISSENASVAVMQSTAVRRLTPTECERLQGFPDGYTAIPWRKKQADQCPDGPRYKALGNSMAVPVMRWIGERIDKVEKGAAP